VIGGYENGGMIRDGREGREGIFGVGGFGVEGFVFGLWCLD
jgi:hypothetical protein